MAAQDDVDWDVMLPVVAACSGTGMRAHRPCAGGVPHVLRFLLRQPARRSPSAGARHTALLCVAAPVTLPTACLPAPGGWHLRKPKSGMYAPPASRCAPHATDSSHASALNCSGLLFGRNARLLLVEGASRDLRVGGLRRPAPYPRLPHRFMPMLGFLPLLVLCSWHISRNIFYDKLSQRLVAVEGEARGAQEIELREAPKSHFQLWKSRTLQLPKKVGSNA